METEVLAEFAEVEEAKKTANAGWKNSANGKQWFMLMALRKAAKRSWKSMSTSQANTTFR